MDNFTAAINALKNGDFRSQWDAVKQLSSCEESVLPLLLNLIHTPGLDVEQEWFVVKALGAFHHPDAILALAKILETSNDEDICAQAAQSLAGMGVTALKSIAPLINDPSRRSMVVRALVQMQHPEIVPLLLEAYVPSPAELRGLILNALDQFQDPRISVVLQQSLADPDVAVCRAAIAGLISQNNVSTEAKVEQIIPFLEDPRVDVSNQAARALGQLSTDMAVMALVSKCCAPSTLPDLQQALIRSLGWIGSPFALDGLIKIWNQLSQQSPLPTQLLQEIFASLAQMEAPDVKTKAAQTILTFLRSPSLQPFVQLRSTAVLALGRIADASMIPDLIDLLGDPDYRARLHIVAALKQVSDEVAYQQIQARSRLTSLDEGLADGLVIALQEW